MTEMDALRLRVAARAYRVTRPDEYEVERGVRRALSAMRRSQMRRRKSLTPAIIVAILAFGTLAYANPNNVRRWMSALLTSAQDTVRQEVAVNLGVVRAPRPAPLPAPQPAVALAPAAGAVTQAEPAPRADAAAPSEAPAPAGRVAAQRAAASAKNTAAGRSQRATWAEVNSALGSQDTPRALAALGDLSRHGDAATRANAQLGIAQLLWSRGDRATACSIARSLIAQKNTPARVQERARALGQSCSP